MDPSRDAGEDSKCAIVEQLLCMACLGPGQTLHVLKHQALQLYNTTVNSGQQLIHNVSPRVCWECEILLKKVIEFRERVTECHDILNSSDVKWSEVTRPSRLQKITVAKIDIPPLNTECSMPEVKQEIEEVEQREPSATEETQPSEVKIEIEEHDPFETKGIQRSEIKIEIVIEEHPLETKDIQISEVKQEIELCMGCLCAGRRLNNIRDKELKYYTDILNQKTVVRDVSAVTPRLCWECCCMLRQATLFSEKSVESYQTLLPSILTADIQDITLLLCSGVSLPPRLRRCVRDRVDIPPHAHTHDPPPPVKLEPGSLGLGDSSPPPAGHVQRTDEPAREVKHTSRRDTAHGTTSNITSDRRHRECTSKQQLISNMYPHNTSVCEDSSHVCVESALQHPRRQKRAQVTSHAADRPSYQCHECSKTFKFKSRLICHMRAHTSEKPYQCSQCSKAYTSEQNLVYHMRTHSGEKPYQCGQCPNSFTQKKYLVAHMASHSAERPHQCSQCSKAFKQKKVFIRHVKSHGAEKPYQCSLCTKAYTSKHDVARHMATHSREKPYQCSLCTKAFTSKYNVARHMRTHSGEKPYQCSQCSKAYNQKHILVRHVKSHSAEKPYQCSLCTKAYTSKHDVARHMATHSREKPYQCSQCTKAFTSKYNVARHMRTHNGEEPYQCSQCSKAYSYKHHLALHMITHSEEKPYQCDQCENAFIHKKHLVAHMVSHGVERPHQCSHCSKAFKLKHVLVRHVKSHSAERPYQCSQCSKAYYRRDALVYHMMTTHSAEKPCQRSQS